MLWRLADIPDFRRWVFEHISDDTEGETAGTIEDEVQRLRHEPEVKSAQFAEELTKKDQQLAEKDRTIAAITTALYQLGGLGTRCKGGATIRRSGPEDSEQKSNATG
ncbi:hypothetical protein FRC08_008940 [Ceratobasidium sp. 394]|nr:hypothetical protein FRC08_008940 [Ceratobasidium sp. 394]